MKSELSGSGVVQHEYKGHTITLTPSSEGLMWACQYVITQSGRTEFDGFPGNTYNLVEDAKSAALEKARTLIDESALKKDPLGTS